MDPLVGAYDRLVARLYELGLSRLSQVSHIADLSDLMTVRALLQLFETEHPDISATIALGGQRDSEAMVDAVAEVDDFLDVLAAWQADWTASCAICDAPILESQNDSLARTTCDHFVACLFDPSDVFVEAEPGYLPRDFVYEAQAARDALNRLLASFPRPIQPTDGEESPLPATPRAVSELVSWQESLREALEDGQSAEAWLSGYVMQLLADSCPLTVSGGSRPDGLDNVAHYWAEDASAAVNLIVQRLQQIETWAATAADAGP